MKLTEGERGIAKRDRIGSYGSRNQQDPDSERDPSARGCEQALSSAAHGATAAAQTGLNGTHRAEEPLGGISSGPYHFPLMTYPLVGINIPTSEYGATWPTHFIHPRRNSSMPRSRSFVRRATRRRASRTSATRRE